MTPTLPETRLLSRWGGPLLGIMATLGLLVDLGGLTLRHWDEARLGVNAIEMAQSNKWLITTFGFKPDLWNTKPPLMIWLQAGLIQLLGPTEWAVRLPAALAALATIGLLYWFMAKFMRRPLGGLLAGIVLVSSQGFLGQHHGHAGDYDALLTLMQLVVGLSVLLLLETKQRRWWVGVGVGLIMATLTKGVAVLLPLPGMALYCLAQRRGRALLRTTGFWLVLLSWMAAAVGWYTLREHVGPGYWAAINENELSGRFAAVVEKHEEPWYYYIARMAAARFLPWVYVVPVVVFFALRHPDARARRVAAFAASWAVGMLVVLTIAKTKIEWYSVPTYPWLALLIGLGSPRLATLLLGRVHSRPVQLSLRVLLTAFLVVPPLAAIGLEQRRYRRDTADEARVGYGLRALSEEDQPPTPLFVVAPGTFYTALLPPTVSGGISGYNASLRFYVLGYPRELRVVPPASVASLRSPGYVLTSTAADSALVRATFPRASCRAVGRFPCWLWRLLPAN
ncbi:glycosyltransferase family 39 protein [Hymenobacter tibetensis]|uniref:Glycosyltransferase family 39 protein n=1 Tax=Hymenobacter tibetensis TaxID=497967 RepID=A0ABY4CZZ0_9BACT|nr:glycosyltransferase family 39 protein [Hymenobacter tibetensis]UOG75835.1 glycosyltransferase family 39 protein [Hymenobacter tibetensis]